MKIHYLFRQLPVAIILMGVALGLGCTSGCSEGGESEPLTMSKDAMSKEMVTTDLSKKDLMKKTAMDMGEKGKSMDSASGPLSEGEHALLPEHGDGYLARIELNSPSEIEGALKRAEELYARGIVSEKNNPVAFVLHGPEVEIFFESNYSQYQNIVDLAAKLSALNVVDVKVCETRLGMISAEDKKLVPFVGTVPFGPSEVKRLIERERYVYF